MIVKLLISSILGKITDQRPPPPPKSEIDKSFVLGCVSGVVVVLSEYQLYAHETTTCCTSQCNGPLCNSRSAPNMRKPIYYIFQIE